MSTPVRALILHDSLETAGLLLRELERGGFSPVFERVHSSETFERALSESAWDVILSDFRLEGFGALPALAILKQRELDTPFIIVSDNIGEETAVKAIKAGAHNCITTGALGRLAATVERELREAQIPPGTAAGPEGAARKREPVPHSRRNGFGRDPDGGRLRADSLREPGGREDLRPSRGGDDRREPDDARAGLPARRATRASAR